MFQCDSNSFVFAQVSQIGLSVCSIPSVLAVPIYLAVCGWLSMRDKLVSWRDVAILFTLVTTICFVGMTRPLKGGGIGVTGFTLIWPLVIFLAGYCIWRLAGGAPLRNWPWYRFGLLTTLTILLADLGKAFLEAPPTTSRIWVIGGAGLRDALVMAPLALTGVFFWLLDCRSPLVFCSHKCRDQDRCRFGLDGKAQTSPASRSIQEKPIGTSMDVSAMWHKPQPQCKCCDQFEEHGREFHGCSRRNEHPISRDANAARRRAGHDGSRHRV